MAATSTYMTFLMHKAEGATDPTKLVDIKEYPDMGSEPENLETTTMTDKMRTYIAGLQDGEGLTFLANYEHATFTTLKGLEGKQEEYGLWLGGNDTSLPPTPTGAEGKFTFTGELSVFLTGKGINEVREMSITITPSTVIEFE